MTTKERVNHILDFRKPDRLPVIEWAPHWDLTLKRWKEEGLPQELNTPEEVNEYFGLDPLIAIWTGTFTADTPSPAYHGGPIVSSEEDYEAILPTLYPKRIKSEAELEDLAKKEQQGAALWIWFEGFFWHPRTLFGIEPHMYAFFDHPDLMKRMNNDLLEYLYRGIEQICEYVSPSFISLGEDMSYNHGPMLSHDMFNEHLADYYIKATSFLKSKGMKVFIDSDGLVDEPVDWYAEVGCEGFLPLEKQAGVDLNKYRVKHPRFCFLGGYDKMCMSHGEDAMRAEFERLLPVMKQGGYLPGVDHQTPPEVSLENYRIYLKLLREYCQKAVL